MATPSARLWVSETAMHLIRYALCGRFKWRITAPFEQPVSPNTTAADKALNRPVDLVRLR